MIRFLVQAMLHDSVLKVNRIGIKLIYFVVCNVDLLSSKTNLDYLIANLIALFNDQQGALK